MVHSENIGRLRWRCRRGMRELDEAMLAYVDHHYGAATDGERQRFEELLDWQDPELYALLCGKSKDAHYELIIVKIKQSLAELAIQARGDASH